MTLLGRHPEPQDPSDGSSIGASLPSPFATASNDGGEVLLKEDRGPANVVTIAKLFVAFVCVTLLVINGWLIVRARAAELAQITEANTNLIKAVSQQIEGTIAEAEHLLASMVGELERNDLSPQALDRMQPMMVDQVSQVEALKGLFFYNADGRWRVNSEATSDPTRSNADRA